ncbi:LysR family transcriptional regulator [Pandoraea thiooxydans]|uniref:LysR family transcriptional regulator n=2 Tax=Pandoraea thiooxydans TaxID=445709 RepID=A0A0G3EMU1_9BURK|nr:LysR family transcriptional regulator [Pandoraea thiooxydans]
MVMRELRDVDLNLLVVFQALYQERQVSLVARRLGLSQPAVSNALARLRKTFNDELFVRSPQGMLPTPLTATLADPIAVALENVARALNHEERFDPGTSRRQFTLAMSDVGEIYFMPALAQLCRASAPGVSLQTVRVASQALGEAMAAGRIDLAIGAFERRSDALFQRRLFTQSYLSLFRAGHPLDGRPLTRKAFAAAEHLFVTGQDDPYDRLNAHLEKIGIAASAKFRVPNLIAVPFIVGSTDLVVTVPQKLAERVAEPFGLRHAAPPIPLPALQTHIFWHRRAHQDPGNQWLRQLLADNFAQ